MPGWENLKTNDLNINKLFLKLDGEWSKYSESNFCSDITTPRPDSFCRQTNLKELEKQESDYIRIHIESPDGLFGYRSSQNQVPTGSVVVYQRYSTNSIRLMLGYDSKSSNYLSYLNYETT